MVERIFYRPGALCIVLSNLVFDRYLQQRIGLALLMTLLSLLPVLIEKGQFGNMAFTLFGLLILAKPVKGATASFAVTTDTWVSTSLLKLICYGVSQVGTVLQVSGLIRIYKTFPLVRWLDRLPQAQEPAGNYNV